MLPKGSRVAFIVSLLLTLPFIAVFLAICGMTLGKIGQGLWMIAAYQRIEAEVTEARIGTVYFPPSGRYGPSMYYQPVVGFRYVVDGTTYDSFQVTPLNDHAGRGWAERTALAYQVGQRVRAYYDPQHPERAFLQATIHPVVLLMPLIPLLVVLTALEVPRCTWRDYQMMKDAPPAEILDARPGQSRQERRAEQHRRRREERDRSAARRRAFAALDPDARLPYLLFGFGILVVLLSLFLEQPLTWIVGLLLGGFGFLLLRLRIPRQ